MALSASQRAALGRALALLGVSATLAVSSPGCATSTPSETPTQPADEAPTPDDDNRLAEPPAGMASEWPAPLARYAAVNRDLADRLRATDQRCPEVARVLEVWTARRGAELRELMVEVAAWEETATTYELQRYYERVFPDIDVRIEAGVACDDHPKARAAFNRFFEVSGLTIP